MKVVIADVVEPDFPQEKLDYRMQELENLVNTYWGVVVVEKIQKRWKPDYQTFLWSWKLEEIKDIMARYGAKVLILWNILKPKQIYNLNEYLKDIWAQAWDRIDLILKIFDLHAKSPEAKLQIELASIKHMWPRIFGMGMELSRQWWGIWTKWIWETNTEIMKRHLQKRILQIEEKLKQYEKVRDVHRKARKSRGYPTVGIVWYTNAWKSSLLNALTKKWVLAENKLFATLWTNVWELFLSPYDLWYENITCEWKNCKKVLLSDTIWFIQDLPPSLIKAFKSTLEDSIESDLLFHVIDISDPFIKDKIKVVNEILDDIWAKQPRIYVFNKIDLLDRFDSENYHQRITEIKYLYEELWLNDNDWQEWKNYFLVSANKWLALDKLKRFIYEYSF